MKDFHNQRPSHSCVSEFFSEAHLSWTRCPISRVLLVMPQVFIMIDSEENPLISTFIADFHCWRQALLIKAWRNRLSISRRSNSVADARSQSINRLSLARSILKAVRHRSPLPMNGRKDRNVSPGKQERGPPHARQSIPIAAASSFVRGPSSSSNRFHFNWNAILELVVIFARNSKSFEETHFRFLLSSLWLFRRLSYISDTRK